MGIQFPYLTVLDTDGQWPPVAGRPSYVQDPPPIIDEVQRAPELFSPVKWVVDQSEERDRIVLTGSQTYHLMKGVSESLAGRMRILEMPSLSLRGLSGNSSNPHPYSPTTLSQRKSRMEEPRRWPSDANALSSWI